jgi:MarR family transcriptional regulator for hemolysin
MPRPSSEPIGLQLARTAKLVSRAFDDALAEAGGSLAIWQLMISLKAQPGGMQRELADAVGIEGPTVTHHLDRMQRAGLVQRTRDPANRRVQRATLTRTGEAMFQRLRQAVMTFDRRLRAGMTAAELAAISGGLEQLRGNVAVPTRKERVR